MANKRVRLTNRKGISASAPPATPGYAEGSDHPAWQPDPEMEKNPYQQGDTSAWAEDPHKGPYANPAPPATPGYTGPDGSGQDHPAAAEHQKAAALRQQVERKAAKCIRIAQNLLGNGATTAQVEDQALDLMDLPDRQIEQTLRRMEAGGFLASEEEGEEGEAVEAGEYCADDEEEGGEEEGKEASDNKIAQLFAKIEALENKLANQNDPHGETLAPGENGGVETDPAKIDAEAEAAAEGKAKEASDEGGDDCMHAAHTIFDAYDGDSDGFITREEWGGSPMVFDALDTNGDGVLSRSEIAVGVGSSFSKSADVTVQKTEAEMLAEMEKEAAEAALTARLAELQAAMGYKAAEEEGGEDAEAEAVEADDAAEEEGEEKEASTEKEALIVAETEDDAEAEALLAMMLAEEAKEEAPEEAPTMAQIPMVADHDMLDAVQEMNHGKEADASGEVDPMGLLNNNAPTADDAALANLFGMNIQADEADDAAADAGSDEAADAASAAPADEADAAEAAAPADEADAADKEAGLLPQERKASKGVKTLGSVQKTASKGGELAELSKLWDSAPDVSSVFNG